MEWLLPVRGEHVHAKRPGKKGKDDVWGYRVAGYQVESDGTHSVFVVVGGVRMELEALEASLKGGPKRRVELVSYPVLEHCCDLYARERND